MAYHRAFCELSGGEEVGVDGDGVDGHIVRPEGDESKRTRTTRTG